MEGVGFRISISITANWIDSESVLLSLMSIERDLISSQIAVV